MKKKSAAPKYEFDIETLRHWKNVSTKAKLAWLESALRFGKQRKF